MEVKEKCKDCKKEIDYNPAQLQPDYIPYKDFCQCGHDWKWAVNQLKKGKKVAWLDWHKNIYVKSWDGGNYMIVKVEKKECEFHSEKPYKVFKRWKLYNPISEKAEEGSSNAPLVNSSEVS